MDPETKNSVNPYIPKELKSMLELPYGYSILLKGEAGVGKSTFALEMLVQTMGASCLYLTTRVSPSQVSEHFPWIPDDIRDSIIIKDATQAGVTINNPLDDEPAALDFSDMPKLLKYIINEAKLSNGEIFVVIDSWDAIQLLFEHNIQHQLRANIHPQLTENLNYMYNAFMSLVREYNIKLILVAENVSAMDYLVDAIVELKRYFEPKSKKTLRSLEIKKSRGVRIANPVYPFTLEDGRFRTFMPWNISLDRNLMNLPTKIDADPKDMKFILQALLDIHNHMKLSTMIIDPAYPLWLDIILENIAYMQLKNNEIFTMMPPDNFNLGRFKEMVFLWMKKNDIDENRYYENIRIYLFSQPRLQKKDENLIIIPLKEDGIFEKKDLSSIFSQFSMNLRTMQKKNGGRRAINYGDITAIYSRLPEEICASSRSLANIIKIVQDKSNSIFLLSQFGSSKVVEELKKASSLFLEVLPSWGVPVINFITPQISFLYGILVDQGVNGLRRLRLFPIV
ncbi:MAG: RAD55 family ATPase [Promethearchaeota archaeon]